MATSGLAAKKSANSGAAALKDADDEVVAGIGIGRERRAATRRPRARRGGRAPPADRPRPLWSGRRSPAPPCARGNAGALELRSAAARASSWPSGRAKKRTVSAVTVARSTGADSGMRIGAVVLNSAGGADRVGGGAQQRRAPWPAAPCRRTRAARRRSGMCTPSPSIRRRVGKRIAAARPGRRRTAPPGRRPVPRRCPSARVKSADGLQRPAHRVGDRAGERDRRRPSSRRNASFGVSTSAGPSGSSAAVKATGSSGQPSSAAATAAMSSGDADVPSPSRSNRGHASPAVVPERLGDAGDQLVDRDCPIAIAIARTPDRRRGRRAMQQPAQHEAPAR